MQTTYVNEVFFHELAEKPQQNCDWSRSIVITVMILTKLYIKIKTYFFWIKKIKKIEELQKQ